ncbi:MAG: permease DsdX [Tessaracoccus sp.]|uniref:gluconate:H+ symporter n=1 Tax=Tessaracoccus sp. TaxID=1971211 RepID=UPI001EBBEFC1|nr:gluconate:H+ symporter [Tessaracoccus sp.]MBK7821420.1 permease DsdX [Tessaracoccus sp.]
MSTPALIAVLVVAIAAIVFLIVKVRLHPALALTLAAFGVGIATGTPLDTLAETIESGVGGTLGFLALIIGFGAILGKLLETSGGAERIAISLLNTLGRQRATWVLMLIGFIAGIPVFVEVGFVLLVPLVFVIAKEAGISRVKLGTPLVVSLMVVHCIVPPHPAATAIAGMLGADVGKVIAFGLLVGLPAAIVGGPVFSRFGMQKLVDPPLPEGHSAVEDAPVAQRDLPGFGITLFAILLPLLIMVGRTVVTSLLPETSAALPMVSMIGNPIAALLISVFFAYWALGLRRGMTMQQLLTVSDSSFSPIAGILLIIGAGGAFNEVLKASGIGDGIADALSGLPVSPIILAWLIALLLHAAVGSATVAMISAAGIVLPMVATSGVSPEVMAIAIGAGAIGLTQVTDSLFWLFKEFMGMSVQQTLRTLTLATTTASVVGLAGALILSTVA